MKQTADNLLGTILLALPLLQKIPEQAAALKPAPDKWSAKEIIGHLIDSACNNQQKFVRAAAEDGVHFPGYEQDYWVQCQRYNEASWAALLELWAAYNRHLAHVMQLLPEERLRNRIFINDTGPFMLEFIVNDYGEHLKHHLKAILPGEQFLENSFRMIY